MRQRDTFDDDDVCPVSLPDVSDDHNPSYSEFDEDLLYTNLRERVRFLLRFINFTEHDVEALNDFQPILLPMVPQLVDNVYHQLFKFDVTKNYFMPRKDGQEGRMLSDLHDLTLDAPQIEMRKRTFAVFLKKLVTSDYDDFATWQYFGTWWCLLRDALKANQYFRPCRNHAHRAERIEAPEAYGQGTPLCRSYALSNASGSVRLNITLGH